MKYTDIYQNEYPQVLRELAKEMPLELYYYGNLELINPANSLSIVGTRKVTKLGSNFCSQLIKDLAPAQTTIVSGLAYGVDSAAHQAALDNNLPTIAVLGSGLEAFDYFGRQRLIFNEMRQRSNCLILSEHPPEFPALGWTFARRNRIIAALSQTTLVVEAPLKSGALITADWALLLKRNLWLLPGSGKNYEGSNKLIQEHPALALQNPQQLLQDFGIQKHNTKQDPLLDLLPSSFDLLQEQLKIDGRDLSVQLSLLEIAGTIKKELGSYYLS
ncbi:MAG: DNA-protecting protein DprA [Cyanobacteria bacterium]|nr:DNA-protecting protein DprA [Cyanobacteriota bacterium]MDA1021665.1 DNA-protecting protein DprA [Cyanobacteriota bacterium]